MADPLGNLEILVLLAIHHCGEEAYGVAIRSEIEERTGRFISVGALYETLHRLERKDYVRSRTGEPRAERGGRARRYYEVSFLGSAALHETTDNLLRMLGMKSNEELA